MSRQYAWTAFLSKPQFHSMTATVDLRWVKKNPAKLSKAVKWSFPEEMSVEEAVDLEQDIRLHYHLPCRVFILLMSGSGEPSVIPFKKICGQKPEAAYTLTTRECAA